MLTVAAAALRACVSESLIRLWLKEGTLNCYRLGGKGKRGTIRIQEEDLDQVMASFKAGQGGHSEGDIMNAEPVRSPYLTAVEAAAYLRTTVQGVYSRVKGGGSGRWPAAADCCSPARRWTSP